MRLLSGDHEVLKKQSLEKKYQNKNSSVFGELECFHDLSVSLLFWFDVNDWDISKEYVCTVNPGLEVNRRLF